MSKQWYFQVMGSEVGPVTSAQLKEKALKGQIDADTLVRLAPDGKWQPAARVKGLLDPLAAASPKGKQSEAISATRTSPAAPLAPSQSSPARTEGVSQSAPPPTPVEERVYHFAGQPLTEAEPEPEPPTTEYDFFEFVAFDQAIGHALHEVLMEYCRKHGMTQTQVTRRALAQFLDRKDLSGDQPQSPPDRSSSGGQVDPLPS